MTRLRKAVRAGTLMLLLSLAQLSFCYGADLQKAFAHPPDSARPWVYWFWLNGNITSNGITKDLEAMKRVGIGGVLIMEVDQGAPVGPVPFMNSQWRALFKHVVSEAQRLGLEVNMNDDAGWNGSGGPWIKPYQSMQKVVWSETNVTGPLHFEGTLPQPQAVAGFYRDIAVQAFPTPGPYRIDKIKVKACYEVGFVGAIAATNLPPENVIERGAITNVTRQISPDGHLVWNVPPGQWTILRFGHTSTGVENAPAPVTGRGLECDKLSKEGVEANFDGMMRKLISDVGPNAGRTLVATHIDSWENGAQNWTARMREEFRKRRGYDLLPFLPAMTGRVVGSLPISERFLWDLRQTISELVVENYAGHMHTLARQHGLKLSIEAYGGPCDDLPYAGRADEPMAEFWIGGGGFPTPKEMASAAHIYGKPILGAEAFTADDREKWLQHPASIKALGDRAFCDGVNRFVFHRYALQPWEADYRPGMTMGPWGLHYERTSTWWEFSQPWHEYLARCQLLLRQGLFVADLCYLQPEAAPQSFHSHKQTAYDYDNCSAEAVLSRMKVKDGRLVLPDGMSYRLLVLPDGNTMTPPLLRKLEQLVAAGATVLGPRPWQSPSLTDYPQCDEEVKSLGAELWGDCDGTQVKEHRFGHGRVLWGLAPEEALARDGVSPDFSSRSPLRSIHRSAGETEIYFVANPQPYDVNASCAFRVSGKRPELWWPDSGRIEAAATFTPSAGVTTLPLRLGPSDSVFVVFRTRSQGDDPVLSVTHDGRLLWPDTNAPPKIQVVKARYGVLKDAKQTRDVSARVQHLLDAGEWRFEVARLAQGDDPASGIVKTVIIEYTAGGKSHTATATDPDTIDLSAPAEATACAAELHRGVDGHVMLEAWQPGRYELKRASGRTERREFPAWPTSVEVSGPWRVSFSPEWGAPAEVTFDQLDSWARHQDPGVKYFSGTATYRKTLNVSSEVLRANGRVYLDLGSVSVMAQVSLNGRDLGTLWKPPFRVDITDAAKPGENALEVKVVNLWVNRLIGDEQLAEDSQRNPDGTLKQWPEWLQQGKPSPSGRFTFTSWRLWKKDSPLQDSGLLGPVTLKCSEQWKID